MNNPTRRNATCICGSGKRYKHCHGQLLPAGLQQFESKFLEQHRVEAFEYQRVLQQGLGKPIVSKTEGASRTVFVRDEALSSNEWRSFSEFLFSFIEKQIGLAWIKEELEKPISKRHRLVTWRQISMDHIASSPGKEGTVRRVPWIGPMQAYLRLSYDLFVLRHNSVVKGTLLSRLKISKEFEGARYETFVAASLVRAGFDIEFEDESDGSRKHCEFSAIFPKTNERFSVEAKHRESKKLRIGKRLTDALNKEALHTRIVFLGLNQPFVGTERANRKLTYGLKKTEERLSAQGSEVSAYVFVTSRSWQHEDFDESVTDMDFVYGFKMPIFKKEVKTLYSMLKFSYRNPAIIMLMRSMQAHSVVPTTFDGDHPEKVFENTEIPTIGQRYLVTDKDGLERSGVMLEGVVAEQRKEAFCIIRLDDGRSIVERWPLDDAQMSVWKRSPRTFFGKLKRADFDDPFELFDHFRETWKEMTQDELAYALRSAPDFEEIRGLSKEELVTE